jgi:hypothetical protein
VDDLEEALPFFCAGVNGSEPFPLDRQWIAATNKLADDSNMRIQNWRSQMGAITLGPSMARSELITPVQNCPGLAQSHQIDFVHALNTPDLLPSALKILLGDPLMLMRNVDTQAGLAKGRRALLCGWVEGI